MTKEEYEIAVKKVNDDSAESKNKLAREYAFSNNSIVIGDILLSRNATIMVDTIKFGTWFRSDLPECSFYGPKLKKDYTPYKNGDRENIWQCNVLSVLKVEK